MWNRNIFSDYGESWSVSSRPPESVGSPSVLALRTEEKWNTRVKKEMNDWLALYRRQNLSVGRPG